MLLRPTLDVILKAGRNITLDCLLAALLAEAPGGEPAQEASRHGAGHIEPGVGPVRDEPQQKQVRAAGDGEGDDGGVHQRDAEDAGRAKVDEPIKDTGVLATLWAGADLQ